MLVATAMLMGLKLVTRDSRILAYGAQGHVSVLALLMSGACPDHG